MWENWVFFTFSCDVPQKVLENSVFSRFSRHFVQSSQEMRQKSFLSFLRDGPQKVWENSVFFPFFERHFVQSSQKKWKNSVIFARCYAKSMTKQCSFTFFKTLCTMFAENEKNQRILSFLLDVPQKVLENSVFSRFSRHFVHS